MKNSRIIHKINLDWKFFRGDESKAWYKGCDDSAWCNVTLPHDWSVGEPFSQEHSSGTGYLPGGIGWYRKTFTLPEELKGKRIYITFDGVYNNSQVWCNSYYIGKRPYGYSAFTYDITDFAAFGNDKNVISVKVNHKDIADSRWFTGSGIYRDVTLTVTDNIHIDQYGVFVTTPNVSVEQATVSVNVKISNDSKEASEVYIKNSIFDGSNNLISATQDSMILPTGSKSTIDQTIIVSYPALWSPSTPYLYSVLTEIVKDGNTIDHIRTPLGIRWFEFDAHKGFFLNGVNMKMKGVCVHHDAGCLGAAVPEKVWLRRLTALKEMGCNAIRMSHNPPASNLLDLCDRMGFLVMDEAFDEWEGVKNKWSTGHNVYPPKHFGYFEDFPQWGEMDIKEMVLRDRNHPSIILWSIGNEVDYPNDPYCHPYFKTMTGNNDANKPAAEREYDPNKPNAERLATIAGNLVKYVKECDTTRPVTAAIAFPELSNLTGYTEALDVVGYNYKEHLYEEDYKKYPDRVTYGSENGSSLEAWLAVRDNDHICAQFIWTGIDYMGEAKGWPVRISESGFLDLAGFKKSKYHYRQSLWCEAPMVFLSTKTTDDPAFNGNHRWNGGDQHWNWNFGQQVEVICYTNCDEVELFLNDKSLGTKKLKDSTTYFLTWNVDFEEGILKAAAKNNKGEICNYELVTTQIPSKIALTSENTILAADGQDITHIEIQITDENEYPVCWIDKPIELSIEGPGEILGMENGNGKDVTPYKTNIRNTFNGKLLSYVRTKTVRGQITITAKSPDLAPAQLILHTK